MTLLLRPAQPTDAGKTGAILSAFIDETPWMPRIHTRAEEVVFCGAMIDRGWVKVAEIQGEVTGFIAREGEAVHALYVTAQAQRQGLGTALLEAGKETGHSLDLWTFQANTAALAFYASHGFYETKRTDGSGNDERLPDVHLRWERAT